MKTHVNSKPRNSPKPEVIKLARLSQIRRISRNDQRPDLRPTKKPIKSKLSSKLVARSGEFLKGLLEKYGSKTIKGDIFKSLLKAKLSDKFRRMQRKHRQQAFAVAAALYHVISRKRDPVAALQTLVKRMNGSQPRGSDQCRTIVEFFFDYGSRAEERTQNRQYACTDANALRYIVRKGIEPQKVLTPEQGESITKWARREAKYRNPKATSNTRPKVTESKRSIKSTYRKPDTPPIVPKSKPSKKSKWTDGKLPILRPSEKRYRFLKNWTRKGVFLVEPEDHGRPLVVIVAELTNATVDEAMRRPYKVRAAIEKALDKHVKKAPAKPPTLLSRPRSVSDSRRSNPSRPHPKARSKPVGQAPVEEHAGGRKIESPNP